MKKPNLLIIFLIGTQIFSCSSSDNNDSNEESIFFGDIELRTQEEINDFGANNYIRIAGSLTIDTSIQSNDNVIDLTPLNSIEIVDSSLNIFRLSNIVDLNLNVKEVGGLAIEVENAENINFPALIRTNSDFLNIRNCSELSSINFPSLISIKAELFIINNPKIQNLDGFSTLNSIGLESPFQNRIGIQSNNLLSSLNGLINVSSEIEFLNIETNESLQNLNGLNNLLLKDVEIFLNPNLNDFCAISEFISNGMTYDGDSYTDGTGYLGIFDNLYNPSLQNFIDGNCSN